MKEKNQKAINKKDSVSAKSNLSQPNTSFELINKYGTYEIQPTADSDNEYPKIAQGLPKDRKKNKS